MTSYVPELVNHLTMGKQFPYVSILIVCKYLLTCFERAKSKPIL